MTRLFTVLATLNFAALLVAFGVGVLRKFWPDAFGLTHFSLGLFAAITTLLVHCIIFTYFLGTGRWVKEVGLAYKLPDENYPRKTRELKRSSFPPALYAMLITIATAAAGAGAQLQEWPWLIHAILGVVTLLVNLWAYRVEFRDLSENGKVLDAVLVEVDRIRAERGLASNAEALRQSRNNA